MPLHRLNRITVAVPDVAATGSYYEEFGLGAVETGTEADGRTLRRWTAASSCAWSR